MPGFPTSTSVTVTDVMATIDAAIGNVAKKYVWLVNIATGVKYGPSAATDSSGNWSLASVDQGIYETFYAGESPVGAVPTQWTTAGVKGYMVSIASNPASGTFGTKSNVIIAPTSINLQARGGDLSGANDVGPLLTTLQGELPSGGGDIYVGPGTPKISTADANNNALTLTGGNVRLIGAGRDATIFNITRNNLTWGLALTAAQQELRDMTVNVPSGVAAPFWLIGMPGVPGRSAQACRFTRIWGQILAGATIPVPPAGPPNDNVHSSVGAGIFALGPDVPLTSTFDAGNAHFEECKALSGCTTAVANLVSGYIIGNGTSGNVVAIEAHDCQFIAVTYGIQLAGGGIRWFAGTSANCFNTDIYLEQGGGDPILFDGFRGENGNRVLWGGNIGATSPVVFNGCEFGNYTPTIITAGQIVRWNAQGPLIVTGGHWNTTLNNTTIGLCTDGGNLVTLITNGVWFDVNPYPAANLARYLRFITNAMTGVGAPAPLAGFQSLTDGSTAVSQSATAPAVATSGTIATSELGVSRVSPAGAVTAIVLAAGIVAGQQVTVVNESAFTITFDVAATSNVADGVSTVIPANRASSFVWDSVTARWYRSA